MTLCLVSITVVLFPSCSRRSLLVLSFRPLVPLASWSSAPDEVAHPVSCCCFLLPSLLHGVFRVLLPLRVLVVEMLSFSIPACATPVEQASAPNILPAPNQVVEIRYQPLDRS